MRDPEERADDRIVRTLLALLGLVGLVTAPSAQTTKDPEPLPAVDPYTKGAPEALRKLGYVSYGPFLFGAEPNDAVQRALGGVPMLWVETEHFVIGSSLEEFDPEKPEEIEELRRELERLRAKLKGFPAKPKKLDPWLRLHLFAARMEELHAEFVRVTGVLPRRDGKPGDGGPPALMAGGKYALLLTEKKSALARFTHTYCGNEQKSAYTHLFEKSGQLFFGVSNESIGNDAPIGDAELCYVALYGVARNLLCSIDGFVNNPEPWWQHGVPLWFARERQPRVLLYVRPAGEALPPAELEDWEPLARGRYEGGAVLAWTDMLARTDWLTTPDFGDNVVLWARIDYLLSRPERARALCASLHGPKAVDGPSALSAATGKDLEALEQDCRAFVLETYRKKRRK